MAFQPRDLHGVFPALITPFDHSGDRIDESSMARLIDFQLASGVQGVVACGSTGESSCLSDAEYALVISLTNRLLAGRAPVVAGISVSSTQRALEMGKRARDAGAVALLVAPPPYNKPSQEGIYQHILAIYRDVQLPIIAYNIPSRSGVGIAASTTIKLAVDGIIIGIKDSTGLVDTALDVLAGAPSDFRVVSGEDSLVWPIMSCGGVGTISASANVVPHMFVTLTKAAAAGQIDAARRMQLDLLPIVRGLFLESNPVPAKAALHLKGVIASPAVRLPLVGASAATVAKLKEVLSL